MHAWDAAPLESWLVDPRIADPERLTAEIRAGAARFFLPTNRTPETSAWLRAWDADSAGPIPESDALARGVVRYFHAHDESVGFPPPWFRTSDGRTTTGIHQHWSRIDDFGQGDIKVLWEPSRFAFAFTLVRAFGRDHDPIHAERFWRVVDDWREHNPPQRGPNWKCGQEVAFRVMAWSFGLYGFLEAAATTPDRVARLITMIAVSGARIAANVDYALSQQNNHGISEGVGLWTIGLLFPFLRAAERWREQGRSILESQARLLIDDHGAFSQHSFNYQRLMLHDYLWSIVLGDRNDQPLSQDLRDRVRRAAELLAQVQDEKSGCVPCLGHNDGSLILPLANCSYNDYRPVTQAAAFLFEGTRRHPTGPWDETLFWLFGASALEAPVVACPRRNLHAGESGYDTLRASNGFAFIRHGRFRFRPAHADLLHVDLWRNGCNLALDPGTYSYNSPEPWNNALARTCYHNTVTVDGFDQIERAGKFLWINWPRAWRIRNASSSTGGLDLWEGGHDGYHRLVNSVACRRAVVRLGERGWLIVDDLESTSLHDYRLHWLFPAVEHLATLNDCRLRLHLPNAPIVVRWGCSESAVASSLVSADPESPRGWRSDHYLERTPAVSLAVTCRAASARFWTLFADDEVEVATDSASLRFKTCAWSAEATLGSRGRGPLLTEVVLDAGTVERLSLMI